MNNKNNILTAGNKENKQGGFATIIGILIVVLLLGFWFVRIYSTPNTSNGKTQVETYNDAIKSAEDVKRAIEVRNDDAEI